MTSSIVVENENEKLINSKIDAGRDWPITDGRIEQISLRFVRSFKMKRS